MTPEQAAAFAFAQAVCAFGEMIAIPASATPSERESIVQQIIAAYGIHHNALLTLFRQSNQQ